MNILVPNHKYFAFILVSLLITVPISIGDAVDDATVPNVMLRVVRVTPDWMPFTSIGGWPQAVPIKESDVLKFYEVAIWEETSSVHLYELPNDYDPFYGSRWNEEEQEWVEATDAEKIAYREQFLIEKYTEMPDAWTDERSRFLKSAFMDIVLYLVNQHPNSEHHLMYNGHGSPGCRLFELQLHKDHANEFLGFWSESLGKPLGVIDMGGPCTKGGFADLDNFCEYARYYVASDLLNGGYTMDAWTFEKFQETNPETQYHNLFAANQNLEDVLIGRIDLKRKAYEYSRDNMVANQVAQVNYLYSCDAFRRFGPDFIAFFDDIGVGYPVGADLYQYMIDNEAPQTVIDQFNDVIVHKADNKDFFQWREPRNGILMPNPEYLRQRLARLNTAEDVNGDGTVNIQDLVLVASSLGETGENDADVNGDEVVDIRDLVLVAGAFGTDATAPFLHPQALAQFSTTDVRKWLSEAQHLNLTDPTTQKGIRFLEQLLATLIPKTTVLLPNYPNPFNPETWIPYKLAESADVTLTIYAINGQIVRQMPLGHQAAGMYENRSRAVYWDGKNAVGESVASGLYFYTLTAGEFTATRKMLIRK